MTALASEAVASLARADRERVRPGVETPRTLWESANRESAGVVSARVGLFRHAMIHAHFLLAPRQEGVDETAPRAPYERCPICEKDITAR